MKTKAKSTIKSKSVWVGLITAIAGVVAYFHEPTATWLSNNVALIFTFLGMLGIALRKVTSKPIAWLPLVALSFILLLPSCGSSVRSPLTGINYVDGRPTMDAQAKVTLLTRISQLLSGVKPKDIFYTAFNISSEPTITPSK